MIANIIKNNFSKKKDCKVHKYFSVSDTIKIKQTKWYYTMTNAYTKSNAELLPLRMGKISLLKT